MPLPLDSPDHPLEVLFSGYYHQDAVAQGNDTLAQDAEIAGYARAFFANMYPDPGKDLPPLEVSLFAMTLLFVLDIQRYDTRDPEGAQAELTRMRAAFAEMLEALSGKGGDALFRKTLAQHIHGPPPTKRVIEATISVLDSLVR